MNIFIYLSCYFLLLLSTLGYGNFFKKIFFKSEKFDIGYIGIFGIFLLIIIAYVFNFFIPLSPIFSLIVFFLGISFFINFLLESFTSYKKELLTLFVLSVFLIVFILTAKNHDDFPYYHFPYISLLSEFSNSLGIGNFNHGFRTPSSIFYLATLFNLPKTNYNLVHIAPVFFVVFLNSIFINKIYLNFKNKENFYIILLSLLSLALINIFFYRMAEHGTDRTAQILILLLILEMIEFIHKPNLDKFLLNKIIILITLTISLKAFYLIYVVLFFPIIFFQKKKIIFLLQIFKEKILYLCLFFFLILILINFFNTGCLVYPLSLSCNESLLWAISINEINYMNEWYQLWSKGGASPNFVVEDREDYISNFNWVNNWTQIYFFNKVSDYLLGLFTLTIIFFSFFFQKNVKYKLILSKKIFILYFILLLLSFEWFYFHPALRYGGYHLLALLIFIPVSIFLDKNIIFDKKLLFKVNILLAIIFIISFSRNINRINKEMAAYSYNPIRNASYNKEFKNLKIFDRINKINDCYFEKKLCEDENIFSKKFLNKQLYYKKK
jgi:hypothetical protein